MTVNTIAILGTTAIAAVFGSGYLLGRHMIASPLSVQQTHTQTVAIHDTVRQTDTVVVARTKLLTKLLQTFLHDTVHLAQQIHDTVWVKQFVQSCDSLAGACHAYQTAAQAKFHADSLLFAAQDRELHAWVSSQPSKFRQLATYAAVAGAGFGLCKAGITIPFLSH